MKNYTLKHPKPVKAIRLTDSNGKEVAEALFSCGYGVCSNIRKGQVIFSFRGTGEFWCGLSVGDWVVSHGFNCVYDVYSDSQFKEIYKEMNKEDPPL